MCLQMEKKWIYPREEEATLDEKQGDRDNRMPLEAASKFRKTKKDQLMYLLFRATS